jgi:hypothetical protein
MAKTKFICPPPAAVGTSTFSDNLVGLQLVGGGGLTLGNFQFTTAIGGKNDRSFTTGVFSDPFNLETLKIPTIEQAKLLVQKNFQVYPNFDLSQITSFSLYGSLQKRLSTSITKIINYFPAAIQVNSRNLILQTGNTAYNIVYDTTEDETTFDVPVYLFNNPFDIDYSVNAAINIQNRPMKVSKYRNLTSNFESYALYLSDLNTEYQMVDFDASNSLTGGTITVTVKGRPFTSTTTTSTFLLKPNSIITEQIFKDDFDEVEDFLLNREKTPIYTTTFKYPDYDSNGDYVMFVKDITWPLDGFWNLDIRTNAFDSYLQKINDIAEKLDEYKTNLLSRFLISGSIKEFDTPDQKVEKVLQLYGRSFDEVKKFIDSLSFMTSVNYRIGNDIPSQLLQNLAQTLGINTNISPITNDGLLETLFTTTNQIIYPGQSKQETPAELNYQYYRNIILNAATLFRSKGTRKSIEYILRMVGAPEALIEFNEYIYIADQKISVDDFYGQYAEFSGGTQYVSQPSYLTTDLFKIQGIQYTGFTTTGVLRQTNLDLIYYPINLNNGYPESPVYTDDYFYQKGAGWFEVTPDHRSSEVINTELSNFNVVPAIIKTSLKPFTYGEEYLNRYRQFPFMSLGYGLTKTIDNKKSWVTTENGIRSSEQPLSQTKYYIEDERLALNVKNMEVYLNMGQGITYDIWRMSATYGYPIPNSGLTAPYPSPGLNDWTVINPKPNKKTFAEFAQTFYNNLINVRNRQTISDGKTGGYPALQSIFWKYLQTEETVNIPSNKFTYQKMIDFTLGIGDYWVRLLEQFVPATTIWNTGQKMDNSIFHRQKFVWRRQRSCEIIALSCIPCEYNGEPFLYDCIDQTTTCPLPVFNPATVLNTKVNDIISSQGYTPNQCNTNTIISTWSVIVKMKNLLTTVEELLLDQEFFTGYGQSAVDINTGIPLSYSDILNYIDDELIYLYENGLNYYISGGELIVSNSTCYDDFTNKRLIIKIGLDVQINCG